MVLFTDLAECALEPTVIFAVEGRAVVRLEPCFTTLMAQGALDAPMDGIECCHDERLSRAHKLSGWRSIVRALAPRLVSSTLLGSQES